MSDEDVLAAMTTLYDVFGIVVEPSGAISLAAVLTREFIEKEEISSIGIILSGGNVDSEVLPF